MVGILPLKAGISVMANKNIDKQIDNIEGVDPEEAQEEMIPDRIFQVYPNSKIPVSKAMGTFWKNRKNEGVSMLTQSGDKDRWEECIRYYQNDQGGRSGKRRKLDEVATGSDNEERYATENIVFANVSALIPAVYAKNPDIEINDLSGENEKKALMYESLVEALFRTKTTPGINLKPKMRRATVMTMLTNISFIELGYTKREDSSTEAINEVMKLSEELEKAKDTKKIAEIEGQLLALEKKVNLLSESGPFLKIKSPDCVILDPNAESSDPLDCQYIIVSDYIHTEYLQAVYGKKNEKGEWLTFYNPTHVAKGSNSDKSISGHDDEINTFTLLGEDPDYKKFGFEDENSYKQACRTKVWYVWDKTTRRVLMFHDADWSWPIWVWDDPYKLTRFYPFFCLSFYTDPINRYARSEVMHYLDQQDEINVMNNERARMRHWVLSKVFVNTSVLKDPTAVDRFLSSNARYKVHGIELPDGAKLSDAIASFPAPSSAFEGLFDTAPILQAVNRLSSVTPVLQNEQFKTNTTNRAIESYESSTQTRLDEKIDAIEDVLADIGQALLEMCIQFMPEEQVRQLIGNKLIDDAGGWTNDLTPEQFKQSFTFQIVGGSTLKPTSKVKKEQALNLGQTLGQFAQASPAVLMVVLKALERAFNEDVVITKQEWSMIIESVQQSMMGPAPSANGGGRPPSEGGQPTGDEQMLAAGAEAIGQIIDGLDPALKQQVGQMIAQGAPLKQIIAQLTNPN
jgi:hypothetical protein